MSTGGASAVPSGAESVTVHSPCGKYRCRLLWDSKAPALLELFPKQVGTRQGASHAVLLTEEMARDVTRESGCGERDLHQLVQMILAALTGRSKSLDFDVRSAAEALGTAADAPNGALFLTISYTADFTEALILIPMIARDGAAASSPSDDHGAAAGASSAAERGGSGESDIGHQTAEDPAVVRELLAKVQQLQAELGQARKDVARLEAEKESVVKFTQTKLQQMKHDMDAISQRVLTPREASAQVHALREALSAAKRDAEKQRSLAEAAKREASKLRDELRRRDERRPTSASSSPAAGGRYGSPKQQPPYARYTATSAPRSPSRRAVSPHSGSDRGSVASSSSYSADLRRRASPAPTNQRGRSLTPPPRRPTATAMSSGYVERSTPQTAPRVAHHHQQHPQQQHRYKSPARGGGDGFAERYPSPLQQPHARTWY